MENHRGRWKQLFPKILFIEKLFPKKLFPAEIKVD